MLYDLAFLIFSIFYLPVLIFKGKLHSEFGERFGRFSEAKLKRLAAGKKTIWIQAVSVGEVTLCKKFIPLLKKRFPDRSIIVSTITRTGNDLAIRLYSKDALIIYFPLDFSFIVKKVISLIDPAIYVMIETEIWPNVLKGLSARSVPSVLINGRISDRSFGKYIAVKAFLKNTLARIGRFCMRSDLDAERIRAMGAPSERVEVTGNMKFDVDVGNDTRVLDSLSQELGLSADEELFVAGSTHRGEERIIIEAFKELLKDFPKLKLLIAPRHVERAAEVREILKGTAEVAPDQKVLILDKIGYLNGAYSFAALVFIGGSLVAHGGQNPIEPAIVEKPVMFGPHMFNFKDIADSLVRGGGAVQVSDKEEMVIRAKELLSDKTKARAMGKNAKDIVVAGRGATLKNIEIIGRLLQGRGC